MNKWDIELRFEDGQVLKPADISPGEYFAIVYNHDTVSIEIDALGRGKIILYVSPLRVK